MNKNSMFFLKIFVCFVSVLFLSSCSKKKNEKLSRSYYKLSLLEISKKKDIDNQFDSSSYKKALIHINKAIDTVEKAEYLAFKATILFKLDKETEGYECFQKALALKVEPQVKMDILNNKACLLAQVGMKNNDSDKIDQAVEIWNELKYSKDYLSPEVSFFNLSKVDLFKNDLEKAKKNLLQTVMIEPNFLDAQYYLAVVACNLKDFELAKNQIDMISF